MNNIPTLSREVCHDMTVVLVDGITRAGKSIMGPILASFERVEIERIEEIFEYVGLLHRINKMSPDAATALLRTVVDGQIYNGIIGRNMNFRFRDHSSVWRNPNRLRFFKRLLAPDGANAAQRIKSERPIYQNMTHDQLANFALFYEAFHDRLRIVEMLRHPVDVVDSWIRRGWGTRYGIDPLALTFCIRYEDQDLPYYAIGWEAAYLAATPLSRVIGMIARLWDESRRVYETLPTEHKEQVFFISFEDFVQRPTLYLQPIANFLETNTTKHTPSALKRQKCPRAYSAEGRNEKQSSIEKESPPEDRETLRRLVDEYETVTSSVAIVHG